MDEKKSILSLTIITTAFGPWLSYLKTSAITWKRLKRGRDNYQCYSDEG